MRKDPAEELGVRLVHLIVLIPVVWFVLCFFRTRMYPRCTHLAG